MYASIFRLLPNIFNEYKTNFIELKESMEFNITQLKIFNKSSEDIHPTLEINFKNEKIIFRKENTSLNFYFITSNASSVGSSDEIVKEQGEYNAADVISQFFLKNNEFSKIFFNSQELPHRDEKIVTFDLTENKNKKSIFSVKLEAKFEVIEDDDNKYKLKGCRIYLSFKDKTDTENFYGYFLIITHRKMSGTILYYTPQGVEININPMDKHVENKDSSKTEVETTIAVEEKGSEAEQVVAEILKDVLEPVNLSLTSDKGNSDPSTDIILI